MGNEEKINFAWIDHLDAEVAEFEWVKPENSNSLLLVEEDLAAIARIKVRTITRLQQEKVAVSLIPIVFSPRRRRKVIVAAVVAILLVAFGVFSTPAVQADLIKVLRFFPGLGAVEEGNLTQLTYVLEKPYVRVIGSGKLTVDSIVLQPHVATITLRGVQTPEIKEFKAEIDGHTYTFISSTRSSSGGDWFGQYSPSKDIQVPEADTITLNINGTTLGPLKLVASKTADDIEHLGSSSVQQDVRVTAFPTRLTDGIIRVQLISKLPQARLTVHSYGVSPLVTDTGLYIEDANGKKANLVKSDTLTFPSDFRFHEIPDGVAPYTIVIPFIEVSDPEASPEEVSIPIPKVGVEHNIDIPAEIGGFPIHFTHIKRTGETSVSVDVDVQFDLTKPQALEYFLIRYPGSEFNDSFSRENVNKTSAVMKTLQLQTKPEQTSLIFSLTEPHFLIKGPWRLPLNLE
ncbi:DUF4179 domain-containing protein [Paenibacillus sp. 19GGS1-52]|uniref:DUF4179 domain-containing protein n=1 Tax=Paenibacillus sp. 19GGS1-52 TaxID=2758563 RepID=UPI001EFAD56D|nr:DUF4179 domain-containing protein [Paenibacillus sp. 19GGS1-52]ULO05094.1 DUF4179 domain-containing protein [Paenibacillus sp. 19GGS1-52]